MSLFSNRNIQYQSAVFYSTSKVLPHTTYLLPFKNYFIYFCYRIRNKLLSVAYLSDYDVFKVFVVEHLKIVIILLKLIILI